MNVAEFKQEITTALETYFPNAEFDLVERRGIEIQGRAKLGEKTFIDIYYSGATSKTSYALIRDDKRTFGYDNFRFWHCHPKDDPGAHISCSEPTPNQVLREMKEIFDSLSDAENVKSSI